MKYMKKTIKKYLHYSRGNVTNTETHVPDENPLTIRVNGNKLATLMCTPKKLDSLTVGFLFLQRIIDSSYDIIKMNVCDDGYIAEVIVTKDDDFEEFFLHKAISTGCTGGITSLKLDLKPLKIYDDKSLSFDQIFKLMKKLFQQASDYSSSGGIHSSAISVDGNELLAHAEDVGRHNTIDKLAGECIINNTNFKGGILLTSGRVSSEMIAKAVRMDIPFVISRTSPTSLAVELAEEVGITLIGYVRGGDLKVYTNPWRIKKERENICYFIKES